MAVSTGRGRFALAGEPIVAVDLINTVAGPGSPMAEDLLSTDRDADAWWQIEGSRVPDGARPDTRVLRRLRSALRETIEALVDSRPVPQGAVSEFLADPAQASRLRRCANPACLMIFVAVNPRCSWCAPGVCGNRVRVARHYRRAGGT